MPKSNNDIIKDFIENLDVYMPQAHPKALLRRTNLESGHTHTPSKAYALFFKYLEEQKKRANKRQAPLNPIYDMEQNLKLKEFMTALRFEKEDNDWQNRIMARYSGDENTP